MISKGYFPYNGLIKTASNCARYVTETMKAANEDGTIGTKLKYPLTVRPTPLFNVVAAKSQDTIYSFEGGTLEFLEKSRRHSLSDLSVKLLESAFSKYTNTLTDDEIQGDIEEPHRPALLPAHAQWLGGLGEGGWFVADRVDEHSFKGTKYAKDGALEHEAIYVNEHITLPKDPLVTYTSHFSFFSISIDTVVHRFYRQK
jgi:hypothetical protein